MGKVLRYPTVLCNGVGVGCVEWQWTMDVEGSVVGVVFSHINGGIPCGSSRLLKVVCRVVCVDINFLLNAYVLMVQVHYENRDSVLPRAGKSSI